MKVAVYAKYIDDHARLLQTRPSIVTISAASAPKASWPRPVRSRTIAEL
jgi:hypothetical protein